MGEELNRIAVAHLIQHTLRSLCIHQDSQWVYAVFWRKLPRNHPPPQWDLQLSNRRNWILAWEDGFCNFNSAAACRHTEKKGLQPELFFKMSHEIYNYGEGLIGKVAADNSHKWVWNEPHDDDEMSLLSDSQPRTWQPQFQSGIKTIALIGLREGVIQLGATNKVMEDPSYVVLLRKKFNFIESIPGALLPHPSTFAAPMSPIDVFRPLPPPMSSLDALLSQLPSITPASPSGYRGMPELIMPFQSFPLCEMGVERAVKEEMEDE
ncbi:protein RICE SALT SENSITIVE 3 isoform X2 [Canna indica]|uniref:Protein RICE SALT SENSITIVE 3 isoform X2 n=1 Tax=Canna indica TaxID=4628 RepID=A0AAQ3QL68_9LILI|nr:protein RICE SALT SENSITIVE 3 isoform X2 [Canna indica]